MYVKKQYEKSVKENLKHKGNNATNKYLIQELLIINTNILFEPTKFFTHHNNEFKCHCIIIFKLL